MQSILQARHNLFTFAPANLYHQPQRSQQESTAQYRLKALVLIYTNSDYPDPEYTFFTRKNGSKNCLEQYLTWS
jgi:hypothetical protein